MPAEKMNADREGLIYNLALDIYLGTRAGQQDAAVAEIEERINNALDAARAPLEARVGVLEAGGLRVVVSGALIRDAIKKAQDTSGPIVITEALLKNFTDSLDAFAALVAGEESGEGVER